MQKWRLIASESLTAPENMAIDDALFQSFDPRRSLPVFHLYGCFLPALSIGRFQNAEKFLKLDLCQQKEVPVVRRISGGGIIFHKSELTYSIVCTPGQVPASNSIKERYRNLTGFLIKFYRSLELNAEYALDYAACRESLTDRASFCLAGRERYDILVGGRKMGGNAQRCKKEIIFQHGSIPLTDTLNEGIVFLRHPPRCLANMVTSLSAEGIFYDNDRLNRMLSTAFCEALNAELQKSYLVDNEKERARILLERKYLDDAWNLDGRDMSPQFLRM